MRQERTPGMPGERAAFRPDAPADVAPRSSADLAANGTARGAEHVIFVGRLSLPRLLYYMLVRNTGPLVSGSYTLLFLLSSLCVTARERPRLRGD